MRHLPTIVVGLAAGLVGSLVADQLRSSDPPAAASVQQPHAAPPPAIVPPGWNHQYVQEPSAGDRAAAEPRVEPQAASQAPSDREQQKLAHYHNELATQDTRVADHARESLDASWATSSADRLRAATAELGVDAREIDCRTTTCVASLEFANPSEALAFLHSTRMSKMIGGFSGMTSTPTPPTSDGAYQLTVVVDR
jgi:hypothetical protein